MSDYDRGKYGEDRGKYSGKKKISTSREPTSRSYFKAGVNLKQERDLSESDKIKHPTILIKAREPTDDMAISRPTRESESSTNISVTPTSSEGAHSPPVKTMTKSIKFLDENVLCMDLLQDYVQENSDFMVIGVIGPQSAGKSTLMNLLAHNRVTDSVKKALFKNLISPKAEQYGDNIKILTDNLTNLSVSGNENVQNEVFRIQALEEKEKNLNATSGIDMFITPDRIILLDCQPIGSVSVLHDLVENEHKRSNLVSEFIPLENSSEIQSLQYAAFLLSICHIIVLVQDWFFDSNIVRFIQTAEMLKPSNSEDEQIDNAPHLVLIHNRATVEDFTPRRFKIMQDIYRTIFNKSKLRLDSSLGLTFGKLITHLNSENCGPPINLFLIPECYPSSKSIYNGHPDVEDLIKQLKANLVGAAKNTLTHVQLTEKTWLNFCSKMWENVKKSSFFVEYTKLMP